MGLEIESSDLNMFTINAKTVCSDMQDGQNMAGSQQPTRKLLAWEDRQIDIACLKKLETTVCLALCEFWCPV